MACCYVRSSEEAARQLMSDPTARLCPEEHLAAVLVNDRLELPPESAQAGAAAAAAAAPAAFESGLAVCDKMRWRDRRQAGGSRKCKDRDQVRVSSVLSAQHCALSARQSARQSASNE